MAILSEFILHEMSLSSRRIVVHRYVFCCINFYVIHSHVRGNIVSEKDRNRCTARILLFSHAILHYLTSLLFFFIFFRAAFHELTLVKPAGEVYAMQTPIWFMCSVNTY